MSVVNINGAWESRDKLVYIITQIHDKFVWKVIHKNGVTETGIGCFVRPDDKEETPSLTVRWNFNDGVGETISDPPCNGKVIMSGEEAERIEWECDKDHFVTRIGYYSSLYRA